MVEIQAARPSGAGRWQVLFLLVITQAVVAGFSLYCFTLLVGPWMKAFSASRGEVLTAITLHLTACGVWAIFLGRMIDVMPARYLVSAGVAIFGAGLGLISVAPSMLMITLVYVIALPISYHLAGPLAAMSLVARNFQERRGLALGLAAMGTSLGGVTLPLVIALLLERYGWRDTLRLGGAAACIGLIPLSYFILRNEGGAAGGPAPGRAADPASAEASLGRLVRRRDFWAYASGLVLAFTVFYGIQNNIAPFLGDLGIDPARTATVVSSMAVAMVLGKLMAGVLADRVDLRLLFAAASVSVASGGLFLAQRPQFELAWIALGVMGLGFGAYLPLNGAIAAQTFGAGNIGRVLGASTLMITVSSVGPVLAGLLRDRIGDYGLAFYAGAAVALLSIPVMAGVRRPRADLDTALRGEGRDEARVRPAASRTTP
ncbi:MFS transporter [Phenylobacterium sp.]|uniref:MFS transporter n=1 Tax=Phenylobacterium sp. TaxID=1871053 RepID=UPI0035B185A3